MPLKLPSVIGHRGAAAYAPENTLESIHTAADMGCAWVELDVKITRDGVPIIFHDDDLERTTNGSGPVALMTYEDIKNLEAGNWFSEGITGVKIPTLEEAIEVILKRDLGVNLEIKPCPGHEVETAEAMLDVLSQIWDDRDRLLISSFSHVALETALDMVPDWYRGFCLEDPELNWKDISDYLDVTAITLDQKITTRELVEEMMDAEKMVMVYTVNDPLLARRLRSWGVDSVFTDDPDAVNDTLFKAH